MELTRSVHFSRRGASLCLGVFFLSVAVRADPLPSASAAVPVLKPLHLETCLASNGLASAGIVAGPGYTDLAARLSDGLFSALGIRISVIEDSEAVMDLAAYGNILALGHYGNNAVLERLYYRWHTVIDASQPGAGGHLLQTVHNPDALGINVIVVGGSGRAGVARAAEQLVAHVEQHGAILPRLWEVDLGSGADLVEARGLEVLDPQRDWPTRHPMEVQQSVCEAAMLYVYTAREEFAAVFKQKLKEFLERDSFWGISDDFDFTMIAWDLLEEAPVFDDAERLWFTRKLWEALCHQRTEKEINYRTFLRVKDTHEQRRNHAARYASSLYFGARYFDIYYGVPETRSWLDDVRTFWRPQMTSFAVGEGSAPIAHITRIKALMYALAEDSRSYLAPDVLGAMADKEMIRTVGPVWTGYSNWAQPLVLWCLAAHELDRPHYLKPIELQDPAMLTVRMPWQSTWEPGRSFWDGQRPPVAGPGQVADWVGAMPVDPDYYETANAYGAKTAPDESAFELLTFRDPLLEGSQYLLLGGHCTGSYSADEANAITFLNLGGQRWLWGGGRKGGRVATVRKHSSVVVVRDGQCGVLPAYAAVEQTGSTDRWGYARTVLPGYNGTDWHRTVVNLANQWVLVMDEITAREPGDFLLESRWFGYEHGAFDAADVLYSKEAGSEGAGLSLRLSGVGWQNQYMLPWLYADYLVSPIQPFPPEADGSLPSGSPPYSIILARRWSGALKAGESHVFANLLHVHATGKAPAWRLGRMHARGFRIDGARDAWLAGIGKDGEVFLRPAPPTSGATEPLPESTGVAAGPDRSWGLQPLWEAQCPERVLSATGLSGRPNLLWAMGLRDGHIQLRGRDGGLVREMRMPGQVLALCAMDLDGDGVDEIVAGSDTGGVNAFTADGRLLWSWMPEPWKPSATWRQSYGQWRTVITDLRPIRLDAKGRIGLLAAGTYFYVLDTGGKQIAMYDREGELDVTDLPGDGSRSGIWRTPERTFVLAVADVDGDGADEIVGDEPSIYKVRVWQGADAKRRAVLPRPSDRFLGSLKKTAAAGDFDNDDAQEVAVGFDAYNSQLAVYDRGEEMIWHRNVGGACEAIVTVDLDGDGAREVVVGTAVGQVQAFDGAGHRRFVADVGEAVSSPFALAAAGEGPDCRLWVGTVNGRLVVLAADGRILATTRVPGYLDHVVAHPRAETILAATAEGRLVCFESAANQNVTQSP